MLSRILQNARMINEPGLYDDQEFYSIPRNETSYADPTPALMTIQAQQAIAAGADPSLVYARLGEMNTTAAPSLPKSGPVTNPDGSTTWTINDSGMGPTVQPTVQPGPMAPPAPYNTGVVPPGIPNSTVPAPTVPAPTAPATPTAAMTLTDFIRQTPGYGFRLKEGTDAINTNAYMRGIGNSGATGKALEKYGQNLADNYYQTYLNNVQGVAQGGQSAAGALAGVSQNYGNNANGINQGLADVLSKGAMANGAANANMWNGVAGSLGNLFGSNVIKGL